MISTTERVADVIHILPNDIFNSSEFMISSTKDVFKQAGRCKQMTIHYTQRRRPSLLVLTSPYCARIKSGMRANPSSI